MYSGPEQPLQARVVKGFSSYDQAEIAAEIKSIVSFSNAAPTQPGRSPGGSKGGTDLVSDSIGYEFDMEATLKLGQVSALSLTELQLSQCCIGDWDPAMGERATVDGCVLHEWVGGERAGLWSGAHRSTPSRRFCIRVVMTASSSSTIRPGVLQGLARRM